MGYLLFVDCLVVCFYCVCVSPFALLGVFVDECDFGRFLFGRLG